jgi:hypothetical protein
VLQRRQIACALFHFSQGQESDRAQRHEKQFDEEERGEQLGPNGRGNASDIADQCVLSSHCRPRLATVTRVAARNSCALSQARA